MAVAASTLPQSTVRQASVGFVALLVGAAVVAVVFFLVAAVPYFTLRQESFGPRPELYWDRRYAVLVHIVGGTVPLLLGPLVLWLGETRRHLDWHRPLGFAYLGGVAVSVAASFYLSVTTPVGFIFASGLFGLGVAWTTTTGMAFLAISRRAITQHREWMIRSYVATLGFVFFRAFFAATSALGIGTEIDRAGASAWFCWAVPLLITEPVLQWRKAARG